MSSPVCNQSVTRNPSDPSAPRDTHDIPGTTPFDGALAQKGYALNKMCFSFNHQANREAFVADPEGYMARYGLNPQQAEAVRSKQVLALLQAGGNAYYLAKFAGIFGLNMQDIGAQQTGVSKPEFMAKLAAANQQPDWPAAKLGV
ncbi:hypothetical protein SMCB_0831 [Serpentinimonas maccroryi]|uniref:Extradiol ring-cleavage dioxygenase LigAB LigA subunit domain-containing protein n=1 Tax=Serpentinimonas maccroryi TaxID=1458426 RepID=A0A060NVX3_9BURK|nr:protocatechuate 4,5-dioxygenase subunit alpha [Serpentinimonas maccroryi]BAO83059.1 hypothetical protein SMCB_0831 [Serpentinimonas maccroryi]